MTDPDFVIKQHDRLPAIWATLVDAHLAPVDITGCVVTFIMVTAPDKTIRVNDFAVIADPSVGRVRYDWKAADTSDAGDFLAEWQVTFPGGLKQTFPSRSYNTVQVFGDLDQA